MNPLNIIKIWVIILRKCQTFVAIKHCWKWEVNLRGGGEFGADWERAGRFASGRLKAYEAIPVVIEAFFETRQTCWCLKMSKAILRTNRLFAELDVASCRTFGTKVASFCSFKIPKSY